MDEDLQVGVRVMGLLDPKQESLSLDRDDEFPMLFHNGDTVNIPDLLPGFALPVKAFFE